MPVSDSELRELTNTIKQVLDQNKAALDAVGAGLSDIAKNLKPRNQEQPKSKDPRTNAKAGSTTKEKTYTKKTEEEKEEAKEMFKHLAEAIGIHLRGADIGSGGGEEGGSGGRSGGGYAGAALLAENTRRISGAVEDLSNQMKGFTEDVIEDTDEYIIRRMQTVMRVVQNELTEFFSGETGLKNFQNRFTATLETSSRNLEDFVGSIQHDFSFTRTSFTEATRSIIDDLNNGGRAFAIYGGTMREYATELSALRGEINSDGVNMFRTMNLQDQDDYINRMYQTMVAQGITERLHSEEVREYARSQYMALNEIANLTGLSLKELQDMNQANQENIDEMVARGFYTDEQGAALTEVAAQLGAMSPYYRDLFEQALAAGPGGAMVPFQDNPQALLIGFPQAVDRLTRSIRNGNLNRDELVATMIDSLDANALSPAHMLALDGTMSRQTELLIAAERRRLAEQNGWLERYFNSFTSAMDRMPGIGLARDVVSSVWGFVGSTEALFAAITANTVAVTANTLSQGFGLTRLLRPLGTLIGSLAGPSAVQAGLAARGLAGAGGVSARLAGSFAPLYESLGAIGRTIARMGIGLARVSALATSVMAFFDFFNVSDAERNIRSSFEHGVSGFVSNLGELAVKLGIVALALFAGLPGVIIAGLYMLVDTLTGGWLSDQVGRIIGHASDYIINKWNGLASAFGESFIDGMKELLAVIIEHMPFPGMGMVARMIRGQSGEAPQVETERQSAEVERMTQNRQNAEAQEYQRRREDLLESVRQPRSNDEEMVAALRENTEEARRSRIANEESARQARRAADAANSPIYDDMAVSAV